MTSGQQFKVRLLFSLKSMVSIISSKMKRWVRQQIVDDDPWDPDTLFPEDVEDENGSASTAHDAPSRASRKNHEQS
jgi:hypothetical protein